MIDYGRAPAADEIEVTLFGPGFGEALAIHLGDNRWMLVDSCVDATTGAVASETYLDFLGVPDDGVRAIVASHWHDDHVRGISKLSSRYASAEFMISSIFSRNEAKMFLAAYSGSVVASQARGASELYKIVKQRLGKVFFVHQRLNVLEDRLGGRNIRVTAFSPVPAAIAQYVANMAQYLPRTGGGSPINHAPDIRPNIASIVVHIDFGEEAILLGSDLEERKLMGWSGVTADSWCVQKRKASAYKIAHHGSHTGDTPAIWEALLQPTPVVTVTPFNLGRHKLPTDADRARIKKRATSIHITSGASRRPAMDHAQARRLGDICKGLSVVNAGFGAVRLRRGRGASSWTVEHFGQARQL